MPVIFHNGQLRDKTIRGFSGISIPSLAKSQHLPMDGTGVEPLDLTKCGVHTWLTEESAIEFDGFPIEPPLFWGFAIAMAWDLLLVPQQNKPPYPLLYIYSIIYQRPTIKAIYSGFRQVSTSFNSTYSTTYCGWLRNPDHLG